MPRLLLLLVAVVVILFSGVVHGLWSNRWANTQELEMALARVPLVPLTFGDWSAEPLPTRADEYARAGAQAYWMRQYKNKKTGAAVTVILMCGRSGKMAVHTPDVCYRGAGYEMAGQADRFKINFPGVKVGELWTGAFAKGGAGTGDMRLYWGWNAAGPWQAPDYPRFTFRGQPFLYKLYLICQLPSQGESAAPNPALPFLREFLPHMEKTLFPDQPLESASYAWSEEPPGSARGKV